MSGDDTRDDERSDEAIAEEVRRQIFAVNVAYGSTIPDALHAAGYSTTSLHLGLSLMGQADVRAEIDAQRTYIREKQGRSIAELIEQLDRDREFAYETRNAATAVAATMAQAKILGALDSNAQLKAGGKRLVIVWGGDDDALLTPSNEDDDVKLIEMEPVRTGRPEDETGIKDSIRARTGTDE